ncbi:PepSY domain-containing protein [Neisseria meningitidis]|nr:PepSY domain-containing protein [Neisseria meningitidis]
MNIKHLLLTAAATALMGISAPALAHHDGHDDDDHGHAAHQHSNISRAQAEKAALARVGGKITDIDLEHDNGRPHYDVEIVKNGQEYKVVVDARTGRVISSRRDD